ncbi:hypothetical protein NDU88_006186 [Pleurodeles waltl]|uniref:Secreted protein n=1 Tax=Pleurodeles waltl TaxID=8319 RepID=A0AAV7SNS8_PLEWA|nr:hypothetical protein NDU88_006186 [Pleurodeles waltl]
MGKRFAGPVLLIVGPLVRLAAVRGGVAVDYGRKLDPSEAKCVPGGTLLRSVISETKSGRGRHPRSSGAPQATRSNVASGGYWIVPRFCFGAIVLTPQAFTTTGRMARNTIYVLSTELFQKASDAAAILSMLTHFSD